MSTDSTATASSERTTTKTETTGKPQKKSKSHSGRKDRAKAGRKSSTPKRTRVSRPYPTASFKSTLELGEGIVAFASGQKVRRLTLLEQMERTPTSHATQVLVTNSGKYGITKGSFLAEWLELTPDGLLACDSNAPFKERFAAQFRLAIDHIPPFKRLYEAYVGKRLPAREVMKDLLADEPDAIGLDECVDLFVVNVTDLALLRQIGGAQTLTSIEAVLDTPSP